jgi:hypothetical protein
LLSSASIGTKSNPIGEAMDVLTSANASSSFYGCFYSWLLGPSLASHTNGISKSTFFIFFVQEQPFFLYALLSLLEAFFLFFLLMT